MTLEDGKGGIMIVLFNPHKTSLPVTLEGEWCVIADGHTAGTQILTTVSGSVTVEAISLMVLVNGSLVP